MKWAWVVWGLAAVLCVGGCSKKNANRELFERVAATLPAEIAAARKEGLLIDANDLKRNPPVADADNAAPYYRKLAHKLDSEPIAKELKAFKADHNQNHLAKLERLFEEKKEAFHIIDQACSRKHCDFNPDWSEGTDAVFMGIFQAQSAVKLLIYRSQYLIIKGNSALAEKCLNQSNVIANHVTENRTMIPHLVGIACRALTLSGLCGILDLSHGKSECVSISSRVMKQIPSRLSIRKPWIEEGALASITIQKIMEAAKSSADARSLARPNSQGPKADYDASIRSFEATVGIPNRVVKDACQARYLANLRKCLSVISESGDPRISEARMGVFTKTLQQSTDPTSRLIWEFTPGYEMGNVAIRYQTRYAIVLAAIHVFESKNKSGRFPTNILDIDPCDGQPLDYKTMSKGFSIMTRGAVPKTPEGSDPIVPLAKEKWAKLDFTYRG